MKPALHIHLWLTGELIQEPSFSHGLGLQRSIPEIGYSHSNNNYIVENTAVKINKFGTGLRY